MTEKYRDNLNKQVDECPWSVLAPYHARGGMIIVDSELDFIEVGIAIADDQVDVVTKWLSEKKLVHLDDEKVKIWNEMPDKTFRMVVVQPYVLIQELVN